MAVLVRFSKQYVFPHWRWYGFGLIALGITTLITLEIPQIAKKIVNAISASTEDLTQYENLALMIIGLGILQIFIRSLSRITIFWPGRKLEASIKYDLFSRLLRIPQTFFDAHGFGDIISRISNDTGHIRVFFAFGVLQLANMIFLSVFIISKMLVVHQLLTIACIAPLIMLLLLTKLLMPLMHKYSKEMQESIGKLTNEVTEAFVNIHTIHANAANQNFLQKLQGTNQEVYKNNLNLVGIRTFLFPLIPSFAGFSQVVILFYGGFLVISKLLTVGDLLAFNFYIGLLSFPLTAIGIIMAIYQRTKVALERISVIEAEALESIEVPLVEDSQKDNHLLINVQNLSFGFGSEKENDDKTHIIKNVSLTVNPGEKIGIFGPIGSGKSILMDLISRIYLPPENSIFFEGKDILSIEPNQLRQDIVYVLQKVHLFSDSIVNNITFGLNNDPGMEKVEEAAKKADIYNDIMSFPEKWQTQVGEQGFKLSGGQKQRIALARAFIREPKLLLLDDVLSAVDHKTESNIIKSIYSLGCSMIISSHRSSVLASCDKILILESGKVTHTGTFDELCGFFKQLEEENPDEN